jgi:membrane fusion protein (multidrug efflux system)
MKYDDHHTTAAVAELEPPSERRGPAISAPGPAASSSVEDEGIARPRKSGRRKPLVLAVVLVALMAAGLGLRHWWQVGRFMEETDDAFVGGDVTLLASKVPGFIVAIAVGDNQRVHAGDLLVRIDDRDYHAQLDRAEALVSAQEAALVNLDASSEWQAALIDQARAQGVAAAAETWRAEADAARARNLIKGRVVSEQDFQQFDAVARKAKAADQAAQASLVATQRQLAVIATQKKQVAAALADARAARELAKLNLGFTEIRAPIDGVVGNRQARVGAYATTGAQLLAIVPTAGLWVDANFKESQLTHMKPGQSVRIRADVLPGVDFPGRVQDLAPATGAQFSLLPPENATGNFTKIVQRVPVRILLDGEAALLGRLRPGLSVIARVDQREGAR